MYNFNNLVKVNDNSSSSKELQQEEKNRLQQILEVLKKLILKRYQLQI